MRLTCSDGSAPSTAKPPARPADHATSAAKTASAPDRPLASTSKSRVPASRAIPVAVRRQVWLRDRGRCRYVDRQTGRPCASRHLLQIDHILPFAQGGGADPENLRLLGAHHRYRHAGIRIVPGKPGPESFPGGDAEGLAIGDRPGPQTTPREAGPAPPDGARADRRRTARGHARRSPRTPPPPKTPRRPACRRDRTGRA